MQYLRQKCVPTWWLQLSWISSNYEHSGFLFDIIDTLRNYLRFLRKIEFTLEFDIQTYFDLVINNSSQLIRRD